jgi:hypothetical protein
MLFGIGAMAPTQTCDESADNPYMALPRLPDGQRRLQGLRRPGDAAGATRRRTRELKAGGSGEQFVADLQAAGYAGHHNASDEDWTKIIIA